MKEWRTYTHGVYRRLSGLPVVGRYLAQPADMFFANRFSPDLQLLNDSLARTDLSGRYWVWAGLLLGWAREGAPLAHDRDADFAIRREDLPRLLSAVPILAAAGFQPKAIWRNNEGVATEVVFQRRGVKFEFFVLEPIDGQLRYYVFGWPPDHLFQVEARIPDQELVTFDLLGRTWLRARDYDLELTRIYGDWRTPRRKWNYLTDDLAIVDRQPWRNTDTSWSRRPT